MKDVAQALRESVDTAYGLSSGGRSDATGTKRAVIGRGRRRRAGRAAVACCAAVAVVASAPVATNALLRSDTRVAGRDVPRLGAALVWERGGPIASDDRSMWFGSGTREDQRGRLTSIARMDLASEEIVEGSPAASSPHNVALGDSGLWAVGWTGDMPAGGEGHPVRGGIERIDPVTLERTAVVEREDSAPYDVAIGEKDGREVVWVVDAARDELLEIDPVAAEVVDVYETSSRPSSVVTRGSHVYVGSSEDHVVERFDAETGATLRIEVPACANDVAHGDGSLWVVDFCGDALHRVDESSGEIVATVDVGEAPSTAEYSEGLVWVGTQDGVVRVDPQADALAGDVVSLGGSFPDDLLYAGGSMWVASSEGVYRLQEGAPPATPAPTATPAPDPADGEVPDGVTRVKVSRAPAALAAGPDWVWAASWTIERIDPVDGAVEAEIDVGGFVDDLELDQSRGVLWALVEIAEKETRAVVAVDAATDEIVMGPLAVDTVSAPGRSIAASGGVAWVPGPRGVLNRVDLEEGEVTQTHVRGLGGPDSEVHVAATAYYAFVVGTNGVVVRVDPETGESERVRDLGAHVASVFSTEGTLLVAQQTTEGELVLWALDPVTGRPAHGKLVEEARGFPTVVQHDGTVWFAQAVGPEGRPVVSEYVPDQGEVVRTELPQGSAVFEIAAGAGGAWVTSGGDFLFRIAPTIEHSEEFGPLGGPGSGRYNGGVAGVAQW